jgi:hypothetical protein
MTDAATMLIAKAVAMASNPTRPNSAAMIEPGILGYPKFF